MQKSFLIIKGASFPGINPSNHKLALNYLYKKYLAPTNIRPVAIKDRYIEMRDIKINDDNFKKFIILFNYFAYY